MKPKKPEKVIAWLVKCPGQIPAHVTAPDEIRAGVEAAARWEVPWRTVAAYLEVTYECEVYKRRCSSCGKEYYSASAAESFGRCDVCKADHARRKAAFDRRVDAKRKAERFK